MVKQITLSKGYVTQVDDEDYDWLNQWQWQAHTDKRHPGDVRAIRTYKGEDNRNHTVFMSRFIMIAPDGVEVDHSNGDSLDNRRCNLRLSTRSDNLRNRGLFKNNKSGFKGVQQYGLKRKWRVAIRYGAYDTAEEAAREYDRVIKLIYGEDARTNFD